MKPFFSAISFLTRIPIPASWVGDEKAFARSVVFYPIVGLLLGGISTLVFLLIQPHLPPFVLAVIMLGLNIALSGGLHLDGIADCADGFLSSQPRERVFEIMKDSHIGVFGVIALNLILIFKVALLSTIFVDPTKGALAVLLMPLAGRCMLLINMVIQPSAKTGGLGALVWKRSPGQLIWASSVLLGIAFSAGKMLGVLAVIGGLLPAFMFIIYAQKKIGGGTGDTLGAASELSELGVILILAFYTGNFYV